MNLPAAELATVKREFRNRHNTLIEQAYDSLKRFRLTNLTSSRAKWSAAIETADDLHSPAMTPALRIAMRVARSLERPRAVKWDDFNLPDSSKAAVTETVFPLRDEYGDVIGEVVFTKRIMTWSIFEKNHAVDTFLDSPDSSFLYSILQKLAWTRGSGGGETYYSERSGTVEVTHRFGPAGRRYRAESDPGSPSRDY